MVKYFCNKYNSCKHSKPNNYCHPHRSELKESYLGCSTGCGRGNIMAADVNIKIFEDGSQSIIITEIK